MSANIKASVDGTQAIIGVGGVDQMTVSNAGVVTANSFVGAISNTNVTATGSTTARTLANRFADVTNVRDFGAVGDGVTDDTAAIQAAINYVQSGNWPGGVVFFPAPASGAFTYYKISSPLLVTKSHITLLGEGTEGTSILTSSPTNTLINIIGSTFNEVDHCGIEKLSFGRTVAPTAGIDSIGIYLENTVWAKLIDVKSLNSSTCFKQFDCTASSYQHCTAFRDYDASGATDKFYGFVLTGRSYSTRFTECSALAKPSDVGISYGAESYGFYTDSEEIRDLFFRACWSDCSWYGYYINGQNVVGPNRVWNVHFLNCTSDTVRVNGWRILNCTNKSQISIIGGWANSSSDSTASAGIYANNVENLAVTGGFQFTGLNSYINFVDHIGFHGTDIITCAINGNTFVDLGQGILLSKSLGGVTDSVLVANNSFWSNWITPTPQNSAYAIQLDNASNCIVNGNVVNGGINKYDSAIKLLGTSENCLIANNLINPGCSTSLILNTSSGTYNKITNNKSVNPKGFFIPVSVPVSGSPWTNNTSFDLEVFISGGTVSDIFVNGTSTGLTSGSFNVGIGETLQVNWSVSPSIKFKGL